MRIVHVVPHIDEEASGPSYSVPRLCQSLAALGHDVELSCLASRGEIAGVRLDVHRQWPVLGRFAISSSHARALWRKARSVDIVHNHSLWSMVNVASGWVVPGRGAKLVTSPRGTLSAWALARNRSVKRALWPFQRRVLTRADMLHATSREEYEEFRRLGLRAPVAIVPNGIDVPQVMARMSSETNRTLLFLSRVHPKKGLDVLLRAWEQLHTRHPNWRLVVAGRGEAAHEHEVRALASTLSLPRVEFVGPLYGKEKARGYFSADVFVLPSYSENFGMAVAEALAHGCPVVVSRGAPWSAIESERCGWWVHSKQGDLVGALDAAMTMSPDQLTEMGRNGREWMRREFGWMSVAHRMESSYRWLLGTGSMPECVRCD